MSLGDGTPLTEHEKYLRAMFYGEPGIGKTTLTGKILEVLGGDTAYFSTDSNWVVLRDNEAVASRITKWDYEGLWQIQDFLDFRKQGKEPFASFKNLVIDTISTAMDTSLRATLKVVDKQHEVHPGVEGWAHFRLLSRSARDIVRALKGSDLNIIYLAHVKDPNPEAKDLREKLSSRPNMPKATYYAFAQEVQLIGWLHRQELNGPIEIQVQPTARTAAKSQISTIKPQIYKVEEIPALIREWKEK